MPRRFVEFHAGECYHIYNRGVDRNPIFFERENYSFFLRKIREFVTHPAPGARGRKASAEVLAYCLMPNHYHLQVRLKSQDFSEAMQSLGQSYTNSINRSIERTGPLFESRFQAIHIDREEYLMHLSRYVHLNPVAAGLVERPEDWEFSSYREYAGLRDGTLPQTQSILREFESREAYRRFVEGGIGREDEIIRHLVTD